MVYPDLLHSAWIQYTVENCVNTIFLYLYYFYILKPSLKFITDTLFRLVSQHNSYNLSVCELQSALVNFHSWNYSAFILETTFVALF